MASRPRKCSARMFTKSASDAKGPPKAAPSPAFHADSSVVTIPSIAARSAGSNVSLISSPFGNAGAQCDICSSGLGGIMPYAFAISLLLLILTSPAVAQSPQTGRDVAVTAPDGTALKATYYASAQPGPAVLLLHMCNTTRKSWEPLGPQLAGAGIHALSVDYRGFGESGGDRYDTLAPQDAQTVITEKWPGDIDAAYDFLVAQPGVDKARIGVAGGSCGVTQAVRVARRHPE